MERSKNQNGRLVSIFATDPLVIRKPSTSPVPRGGAAKRSLGHDTIVVCDCHCIPMYRLAVLLDPRAQWVACWTADCGRYYDKSQGYFYLRQTRERIDRNTRGMICCQNPMCPTISFMGLVHCAATAGCKERMCWHCFECGSENELYGAGNLQWYLQ